MPVNQIINPAGTEGEGADYGHLSLFAEFDPAQETNLQNGTVVVWEGTGAAPTGPYLVKAAPASSDFLTAGVIVNAPTGGYAPGQVCEVLRSGICQVLYDDTAGGTTEGELAVRGTTSVGAAAIDAAAVLGKTIGVCLETLTIASGTALVWTDVHLM